MDKTGTLHRATGVAQPATGGIQAKKAQILANIAAGPLNACEALSDREQLRDLLRLSIYQPGPNASGTTSAP